VGSPSTSTDPEAARRWIDDGAASLDGLDVLYNNAAGFGFAPFRAGDGSEAVAARDDRRARHRLPHDAAGLEALSKRGGSIINTASLAAMRGIAPMGQVAHAAAKGGVIAMTRALAAKVPPTASA